MPGMPICGADRFCRSPDLFEIFSFCRDCRRAIHESCGIQEENNIYVCHLCVERGRESNSYKVKPPTVSESMRKDDVQPFPPAADQEQEAVEEEEEDEDEDEEDQKMPAVVAEETTDQDDEATTDEATNNQESFLASSPAANTRQRTKLIEQPPSSRSIRQSTRRAGGRKQKDKGGTGTARKRRVVAAKDHTTSVASINKRRLRKTSQQKAFLLSSDKKKPDPLKLKRVAFDISDNGDGASLVKHFGGKDAILSSLSKGRYLFGTIDELSKRKGKSLSYEVQWDDSVHLGSTSIELSCLIPAIELATQLKLKAKEGTSSARLSPGTPTPLKPSHVSKLFGKKMLSLLLHVDEGEEGEPEESDLESVSSGDGFNVEDDDEPALDKTIFISRK